MSEQRSSDPRDASTTKLDGGCSRADRVVAHLRAQIREKGLRPGAKLPSETKIATDLGVSRPIVREAMRTLAATGLIEMAVGRRATISPLDGSILRNVIENAVLIGQADIHHVMEMRRAVEIAMIGLAASRRSEATAKQLRSIVAEMAGALGDAEGYATLDLRLHLLLAEATGNPVYVLLVEAFRQIFKDSMAIGIARWAETPELDRVQQLHEEIVAAVAAGDPAAAATAMRRHFDSAIEVMFPTGVEARRRGGGRSPRRA